jgi:hypothetical protein
MPGEMKKAISQEGVNVVISVGPCALWNDRKKRAAKIPIIPKGFLREIRAVEVAGQHAIALDSYLTDAPIG